MEHNGTMRFYSKLAMEGNPNQGKEFCNRGYGFSAAIKLGTPESGFFHFGPRLTWIL